MSTSQANLGYGKPSEATIDQANIAMRAMPWYQEQMQKWGQDPGHPTLSKDQSKQILRQAQANGYVVDEGNMEVDNHGNFNPKGHKLRNTLIVAGIAAATIATMGAAGVFSGAAGATGGGLGGGMGGFGGLAGGGSAAMAGTVPAAAVALPAAAGVGGLTATSLGLPVTAGLGTAGGATAATTAATAGGAAATTGAKSGAGSLMSRLLNPDNLADAAKLAGDFSSGAQNDRLIQGNYTQDYDKLMLEAQTGRNQNESDALKKLAQTSYIKGGGSQFKPQGLSLNGKSYAPQDLGFGPTPVTDLEKDGASALQSQLISRLSPGGSYTPHPLEDYARPGAAEKAGDWIGTALGGAGTAGRLLGYGNK